MNKNNKGFTLVELLAVIVILGMIMAFTFPNIYKVINKNKEDNYEQLKDSIISAAKIYISDYRYKISLDSDNTSITSINGQSLSESKILIETLVDEGNIKTDKNGNIYDPRDKSKCLDTENSYIKVTYSSSKKDYIYNEPELEDSDWNKSFCK